MPIIHVVGAKAPGLARAAAVVHMPKNRLGRPIPAVPIEPSLMFPPLLTHPQASRFSIPLASQAGSFSEEPAPQLLLSLASTDWPEMLLRSTRQPSSLAMPTT